MHHQQNDDAITFSARILGALFYFAPDSEQAAPLISAFRNGSWAEQWPQQIPVSPELIHTFQIPSDEPLTDAWQRLFIGPYALPAPPWGSVWLDRESVLFGDSRLALRQWMRDNKIAFQTTQNEPEDHFGTLLLLCAWLKESGREKEWQELLAWHLLPWAERFLLVFVEQAGHPFYEALGKLAQQALASWKTTLLTPVADKTLYR